MCSAASASRSARRASGPAPGRRPLRAAVQVVGDLRRAGGCRRGRASRGGRRGPSPRRRPVAARRPRRPSRRPAGRSSAQRSGRHRTGQPQHHGHLDQRPDLGQLGELAGAALGDPEAAVGHDLDGALAGELLHRLADRRGRDAEALAERRARSRPRRARAHRRPARCAARRAPARARSAARRGGAGGSGVLAVRCARRRVCSGAWCHAAVPRCSGTPAGSPEAALSARVLACSTGSSPVVGIRGIRPTQNDRR